MSGAADNRPHVVANLTSFNRREQTLAALAALQQSASVAAVRLSAVLVDDNSSDGTAEAVRQRFPWVRVLQGSGDLFWTRGMHRAMHHALQLRGDEAADYMLWLNDDTLLLPQAMSCLMATSQSLNRQHAKPAIVVGATADPASGQLTYAGLVARSRFRRFSFRRVFSPTEPLPCETMNGNVVLLPIELVRQVGNLDPAFSHGGGDIDYGLRVHKAGFPLTVAPGVAGHCGTNPSAGGYTDMSAPLRQRWHHILQRKGLPVGTWLPLTRKHGGLLWPLYFAWPYLKVLGSSWTNTNTEGAKR